MPWRTLFQPLIRSQRRNLLRQPRTAAEHELERKVDYACFDWVDMLIVDGDATENIHVLAAKSGRTGSRLDNWNFCCEPLATSLPGSTKMIYKHAL